ncbi:MAG: sigma factor [Bacteroidota bacterium]
MENASQDLQSILQGFFEATASREEEAAFRAIVRECHAFGMVLARRYFSDPAEQEDCVQESFVKLYNALKRKKAQGQMPDNLKAYWARAVQNHAKDILRASKKYLNGLTEPLESRHDLKEETTTVPNLPLIGLSTYFVKDELKSMLLFEWILVKRAFPTLKDLAEHHGLKYHRVTDRIAKGMTVVAERIAAARQRPRPVAAQELTEWLDEEENEALSALGKLIEPEEYSKVNQRDDSLREQLKTQLIWWRSMVEKHKQHLQ